MSRNDRNLLILGALGIVILIIIYYFFLLSPLLGNLNEQAKAREDKQAQLDQVQQEVNELEEVRRNSPEIERQLLELSKRIPTQPQIPTFVVQVQEIAEASGVTQLTVEPGDAAPPAGGGDYQVLPVTMQFNGTYDEMQDFLLRTRNLARLVAVTDVSYCRADQNGAPKPIDDEHSCPVTPPEQRQGETTSVTTLEVPLLVEIQANIYFQPKGVPSGTETTAPTPSESTTPAAPAQESTGG
jgi:type IV pilus assembly protein PilO